MDLKQKNKTNNAKKMMNNELYKRKMKKMMNRLNTNIKIYSINCLFVFSKVSPPLYYVVNLEQILEVK